MLSGRRKRIGNGMDSYMESDVEQVSHTQHTTPDETELAEFRSPNSWTNKEVSGHYFIGEHGACQSQKDRRKNCGPEGDFAENRHSLKDSPQNRAVFESS